MDAGLTRKKAVSVVGAGCFLLGLPSALSLGFFNNQDFVWGLGLMVSGFFFIFLVLKTGPKKFRQEIISNADVNVKLGKAFDFLVKFILPVQFLAMMGWWFYDSYKNNPDNWFNPFSQGTLGTVFFQWIVAISVFLLFNKFIAKRLSKNET